jgi:MoaA/NifB/PqqE/SkfB family radical SAM enzyme
MSHVATPIDQLRELHHCKQQALRSFVRFLNGDGLPAWPLEIFIEVSNVCNLKCAMCGTFSAANPLKHLLMSEVDRGFFNREDFRDLDLVLRHALTVHAFGYGEPTIHPGFKDLIRYLSSFAVFVDFFTNGMALDEDMCQFLVDSNVGAVCVSFSGSTKADYENLYIGGNFDVVLGGIRTLKAAKTAQNARYPLIHINSIGYEHHIQNLVQFVELMASAGVDQIFVKRASPDVPVLNDHISICRPWKEGLIVDRAREAAARLGVALDASVYESTAVASEGEWVAAKDRLIEGQRNSDLPEWRAHVDLVNLKAFSKNIEPLENKTRLVAPESAMSVPAGGVASHLSVRIPPAAVTPCMEPFKTMYVQQDGTVKPCCFAPRGVPPLGDITNYTLDEVWNGSGFRITREAILQGRYPWKVCGNCIMHNHAPQHHYISELVGTYRTWYHCSFANEFVDNSEYELILRAPDNHTVTRLHEGAARARCEQPRSNGLKQLHDAALCNIDHVAAHPLGQESSLAITLHDRDAVLVEGWAVDPVAASTADAVEVDLDGQMYSTQYGLERQDVARFFGIDEYLRSGFLCWIPYNAMRVGQHTMSLRIIASRQQGYYHSSRYTLTIHHDTK